MGDVYASAVGTTVLQIKEIPPRPPEFDGALCLFGLKPGVDEAAVRQALIGDLSTELESCDLTFESGYGIVRFTTHEAALQAKAANTFSELCAGVETRYNGRSYDDRGWCDPPRPSFRARIPSMHATAPPAQIDTFALTLLQVLL